MKNEKTILEKGIENILSKYYWHFNNEQTRQTILGDIKQFLKDIKFEYSNVTMNAENGINVSVK